MMIAANLDNVALIEKRGASMRQVVGPHGDGCDCGGGHLLHRAARRTVECGRRARTRWGWVQGEGRLLCSAA